jgi:hypothetical protein
VSQWCESEPPVGGGDGPHTNDLSCACWRHVRVIPGSRVTCGRTDQLLKCCRHNGYKYCWKDMTSRIFIMPTFFKFITSQRGAQQILDSDGYIYSQKKSRDTALTSTKYNPPTKCKCHIYLVPSRQLPHSGYTAPQPLCISNMPKLLPLRTSSYLPPAPRHAEKSPSSSTTGRLRGVLNGDWLLTIVNSDFWCFLNYCNGSFLNDLRCKLQSVVVK